MQRRLLRWIIVSKLGFSRGCSRVSMASFNDSIIVKLFRIAIKLWFSKSSIKVHPSFSDSAIKEIQGVARVCGHYTDESISKVERNGSNEERNMWRRLLHDRVKKSSFFAPYSGDERGWFSACCLSAHL
jgi:hypothetical protein